MKSDMVPSDDLIFCEPDPMQGSAEDGDGIDSIIALIDSALTAGEAFSDTDGNFDDVVTLADLDHDFASGMSDSSSVTWDTDEHGPLFDLASVHQDPRSWDLAIIVSDFIKQSDSLLIVHLLRRHDPDETKRLLADPFLDYFASHYRKRSGSFNTPAFTKEQAYYACLDLIIRGFDQAQGPSSFGFSVHQVARTNRFAKDKAKEFINLRENDLKALAQDVYQNHRAPFISPTRDKEHDRDLLPVEKARVFMNGLRERKNAGSLIKTPQHDEHGQLVAIGLNYKPLVIFHHEDQARIRELFEHYQSMNAMDLLTVLDRCIQVHIEGDQDQHKAFHAEKGRIIAFLTAHLKTITEELKTRYSYDYSKMLRI